MALEFHELGVDVITTGNHAWDQKQIIPFMNQNPWIIRPLNYPDSDLEETPGQGSVCVSSRVRPELSLVVFQVMGRVFMDSLDCPFQAADRELKRLQSEANPWPVFVDFHGEASSEKQAFQHYMDGRVAAVVGSHAHVQTADERILPGGTAAITDVGMSGCFDSVIGVKKEIVIRKFLTKRPQKFEPASGPGGYGAVLIEIDPLTRLSKSIQRFREEVIE
jgi:metallophosphoesterase (TIGR00282 family)